MKKTFLSVLSLALLISLLSFSVAFADPISTEELPEKSISIEEEDSFGAEDAEEPNVDVDQQGPNMDVPSRENGAKKTLSQINLSH